MQIRMPTKITKISTKKCRPFSLDVMVMNPEADFKFALSIELACSPEADQIWKLVFDLFKKVNNDFVQVLHVSFQAEAPVEIAGVQATATNGTNQEQADVVVNEIHPMAKQIASASVPSPTLRAAIHQKLSKVAAFGAPGANA